MPLIDTHVHFDHQRFDSDRDAVYQRAMASNVTRMIIPAVCRERWTNVTAVARQYPGVFASYGLHPMYLHEHHPNDLPLLEQTITGNSCVAIGECGLDGTMNEASLQQQHDYFQQQLQLAKKHQLPVILHARGAVEKVILALRSDGPGKGVVHSYNGSLQQAYRLIDMGYHLSFGGPVTYTRARKLQALVRQLPLDSLLLETDAPDQTGSAHHGTRNEPAYLTEVLTAVAAIRGTGESSIAQACNRNACGLFGLPAQSD